MFFSLRQDAQEPGDGQTILTPDPTLLRPVLSQDFLVLFFRYYF